MIPRLITSLKAPAPSLSLVVEENFTDDLTVSLRCGELNAAIMSLPFQSQGLISRPLYDEPFKVALPGDHPLAKKKRIDAAELADQTLLLLAARNCFRDQVMEACPGCITTGESGKTELTKTLEGSSLNTISQMGAGVTILPSTMRINEDLGAHLAIRPFTLPVPSRTVAIFYRRGFARPALINCLAQAIRAADLAEVKYLNI